MDPVPAPDPDPAFTQARPYDDYHDVLPDIA
jgi:hypothetical protein